MPLLAIPLRPSMAVRIVGDKKQIHQDGTIEYRHINVLNYKTSLRIKYLLYNKSLSSLVLRTKRLFTCNVSIYLLILYPSLPCKKK